MLFRFFSEERGIRVLNRMPLVLAFTTLAVIFFTRLDPDFGFHLRTGQLIWERKEIPRVDWYSFSMPDFPWVDHEWLSETSIFFIHSAAGYYGLAAVFCLMALWPFYSVIRKNELKYYAVPVFFGVLAIAPYAGIRLQVLTWLFIFLLADALFEKEWLKKKIIWILPAGFALWANLHGGFFLGLAIFCFALAVEWWRYLEQKNIFWRERAGIFAGEEDGGLSLRELRRASMVFAASFAATFANPYGYRVYEEIFRTLTDSFLKQNIAEWMPLFLSINWPSIVYLGFFSALTLTGSYRRRDFWRVVLAFVLLIMAMASTRHLPLFVLISLPIMPRMIQIVLERANRERLEKIKKPAAVFVAVAALLSLYWPAFPFIGGDVAYPSEAAVNIARQDPEKTFNYYGWGGYLIRQIPGERWFVDGRMPSWRQGEEFAFGDYIDAVRGRNTENVLAHYGVKRVMMPHADLSVRLIFEDNIPKYIKNALGIGQEQFKFTDYLRAAGWREVYSDDTAVILEK